MTQNGMLLDVGVSPKKKDATNIWFELDCVHIWPLNVIAALCQNVSARDTKTTLFFFSLKCSYKDLSCNERVIDYIKDICIKTYWLYKVSWCIA